MTLIKEIALVAGGGAAGAALRHLAGIAAFRLFGSGFPVGTLFVNVVGSFAMGVFIEYLVHRLQGGQEMRLFIATGLLGGFTTFSAFSLDFAVLFERGAYGPALVYLLASVGLSILALFAGLAVMRLVYSG